MLCLSLGGPVSQAGFENRGAHQGGEEARHLGPVSGSQRHEARVGEVDAPQAISPIDAWGSCSTKGRRARASRLLGHLEPAGLIWVRLIDVNSSSPRPIEVTDPEQKRSTAEAQSYLLSDYYAENAEVAKKSRPDPRGSARPSRTLPRPVGKSSRPLAIRSSSAAFITRASTTSPARPGSPEPPAITSSSPRTASSTRLSPTPKKEPQ